MSDFQKASIRGTDPFFGVGPLENLAGFKLDHIFGIATLTAAALAVTTLIITRNRHAG